KRLDEAFIEARFEAQRGARRSPRAPEHPARPVERFCQRRAKIHMAGEDRALRLRLTVAAHAAISHDAPVLEEGERGIKGVEGQPARCQVIERTRLQRKA